MTAPDPGPLNFEGMAALDLGELDFPDDVPRIDAVLARCRDLGLRTNWKDSGQVVHEMGPISR